MKKINSKTLLFIVAVSALLAFAAMAYTMVEYRTFGGPRLTRTINKEFNVLENFFQDEPDEQLVSRSTKLSMVKVPIFIYHSIRPYIRGESVLQDRFDITPELFEQQLIYLKDHGYITITPNELVNEIKTGTTTLAKKPVLLTFDDGWENQYVYAFPLLQKYHMVATFYVYTRPIDNQHWSYLSWDQLREMSASGMTIGSHTLTHPLLKHVSSVNMKNEITESKKAIERELKKPVFHFAQPFGYSDQGVEMAIKEAGYQSARGTHKGVYHSNADLFNLQGYFITDNFNDFLGVLNKKA